jgi:hypothetical protein
MKNSLTLLFTIFALSVFAQNNVGIGTVNPDQSAMLDVVSSDKGLLMPRITTAQRLAITTPANSLLVFDTNIGCFFYWSQNTAQWESLCSVIGADGATGATGATGPTGDTGATGATGADWNITTLDFNSSGTIALNTDQPSTVTSVAKVWLLNGNAGTTSGTDFIGTTDAIDWVIKTTNTERARVTANGFVGIGTATPAARLSVTGAGTGEARIGDFCGGDYTSISLNAQALACGSYNLMSSPSDQNLYINRPSGNGIFFRQNNNSEIAITPNGNFRVGVINYPNQCGGTNAVEDIRVKLSVMSGFSSFGNFNNDPNVNANPPSTTWAGGVGSLTLGMNRSAGTSNVDFWNSSDPNNGAAALGTTNRGYDWRNFQASGANCVANLMMTLDGDGDLTLARYAGTGGRAYAFGFNNISDGRTKTNFSAVENNTIDKIMQLKPLRYQFYQLDYEPNNKLVISNDLAPANEVGLIAQEVYQLFPEVVSKPTDEKKELWGIDYSKLSVYLVKAMQEQQQMINDLKGQVSDLKNQLSKGSK